MYGFGVRTAKETQVLLKKERAGLKMSGGDVPWKEEACAQLVGSFLFWIRHSQWRQSVGLVPSLGQLFRSVVAPTGGIWVVDEPCGTLRVRDPIFAPLSSLVLERSLIEVDVGRPTALGFLSAETILEEAKRSRLHSLRDDPRTLLSGLARESGDPGDRDLSGKCVARDFHCRPSRMSTQFICEKI